MKKINRLMGAIVIVYLLIAGGILLLEPRISLQNSNQYKVEINRIYAGLDKGSSFTKPDFDDYQYIKNVEYISVDEKDSTVQKAFYKTTGENHMEVVPYYVEGSLLGYLRFDYIIQQVDHTLFAITEIALFLLVVVTISMLLYIRHQILKPFNELSEFPYELSKGHLQGELKENQNRYFGKFVWGLGLLRDKLDVTRNKELELEKQKKLMLLSLSHDIKTPLSTIKLYSKALMEDVYETEERKKEAAGQIGEKTDEIERFVNEIIKASTEDILDIEVEIGDFYLKELVDKVENAYKEKSSLKQILFTVGAFDNKLLRGDVERIYEVIGNVIENAFKYGDGKKISISFLEEEYCQLIRIHNSGQSVKENEFNHLFDSFFRGSNSEGKPGNGLGLYISRKIMHKMEGELFVEKESDGMSFVLVIKE